MDFIQNSGISLSYDDVIAVQPNRPPFLFIDKAFSIIPEKQAGSEFKFIDDWDIFKVHFHGAPMVPATIVFEMMMQTAALACFVGRNETETLPTPSPQLIYLTSVTNGTIRRKILPGEEVTTFTSIVWRKASFGKASARVVTSGGADLIATATLQFFCDF